jgi:hypothetical protein
VARILLHLFFLLNLNVNCLKTELLWPKLARRAHTQKKAVGKISTSSSHGRTLRYSGVRRGTPAPLHVSLSLLSLLSPPSRPGQSHAFYYYFPHHVTTTQQGFHPTASHLRLLPTTPFRSANPSPNLVAAQAAGPTRAPPSAFSPAPAFLGSPVPSSHGARGARVFAMDPRRTPPRGGSANGSGGGLSYSTLFNLEVVLACCALLSRQHVFLSAVGILDWGATW